MAAWKLSATAWDALDELRFTTADATVFRNATAILMTAVGRSKPSIARDLGCSVGTIDNVRRRYRELGITGLLSCKPPGRPSRATPEYRALLRTTLQTSPLEFGYGFSVWSLARLNAHLRRATGISFSDDQLGRIVHQEAFSVQRPKHTMKGKRDETAYRKAARRLCTLKKTPFETLPTSC